MYFFRKTKLILSLLPSLPSPSFLLPSLLHSLFTLKRDRNFLNHHYQVHGVNLETMMMKELKCNFILVWSRPSIYGSWNMKYLEGTYRTWQDAKLRFTWFFLAIKINKSSYKFLSISVINFLIDESIMQVIVRFSPPLLGASAQSWHTEFQIRW